MKQSNRLLFPLLMGIIFTATSCEAIADIFKAGVWVGVIIVVLVIALIFWLINKAKR